MTKEAAMASLGIRLFGEVSRRPLLALGRELLLGQTFLEDPGHFLGFEAQLRANIFRAHAVLVRLDQENDLAEQGLNLVGRTAPKSSGLALLGRARRGSG